MSYALDTIAYCYVKFPDAIYVWELYEDRVEAIAVNGSGAYRRMDGPDETPQEYFEKMRRHFKLEAAKGNIELW